MPNMPGRQGRGQVPPPGAPTHTEWRHGGSSPGRAGPGCGGGAAGAEADWPTALPCAGAEAGAVTFRGCGQAVRVINIQQHVEPGRGRACAAGAAAGVHTPPPRSAATSRNGPQPGSPAPSRCPPACPRKRRWQTPNTWSQRVEGPCWREREGVLPVFFPLAVFFTGFSEEKELKGSSIPDSCHYTTFRFWLSKAVLTARGVASVDAGESAQRSSCALPHSGHPQIANSVFASRDVNTCTSTDVHTEPFFNGTFIER